MEKMIMERKAADNKYLHRDFHVTADQGICYIGEQFGTDAVVEYLSNFAEKFYSPLIQEIREKGLLPLKQYFEKIYLAEEASEVLNLNLTEYKLTVQISECPAVRFMKSIGHTPCQWYGETVNTVYRVIAEKANMDFSLAYYEDETGKTEFSFTRRNEK